MTYSKWPSSGGYVLTHQGYQYAPCAPIFDHLGHHASTCKRGGDIVFWHKRIRNIVADVEVVNDQTPDHSYTWPTNVLIQKWTRGLPAGFGIS